MIDLEAIAITCEQCHQHLATATRTTTADQLADAVTDHRRHHSAILDLVELVELDLELEHEDDPVPVPADVS